MTQYTTKQGDTFDLIAWRFYKTQSGRVVEQLIDANPGLSERGPVLPAGTLISLPEITPAALSVGVALWD